jgi:hypothetical protein
MVVFGFIMTIGSTSFCLPIATTTATAAATAVMHAGSPPHPRAIPVEAMLVLGLV